MSILKKRRERKLKIKKDIVTEKTGIEVLNLPKKSDNTRLFDIICNVFLNFFLVIGTLGTYVSGFDVKFNFPLVIAATFLIAVFMSFIYYNRLTKILGYLAVLFIFFYGIINYGFLVRSGFSFVCNDLMEYFEGKLNIPLERTYDTYGFEKYYAITFSFIFIIFSCMLMFNMIISESKGFVWIFIFTFPIVQMPLYFDEKVNMVYFSIYIITILLLFFMRSSGHSRLIYKRDKDYEERWKEDKVTYDYISDGKYNLSFLAYFFVLVCVMTILLMAVMPDRKFSLDRRFESAKTLTRDSVRKFVMVGFWGMFQNEGGIAAGVGRDKLGSSKYATMDDELDIKLTTVLEENEKATYLKDFNGTFYDDNYWYTISEYNHGNKLLKDYGLTKSDAFLLNYEMADAYNEVMEGSDITLFGRSKKYIVDEVATSMYTTYTPPNGFVMPDDYALGVSEDHEYTIDDYKKLIKNDDEYVRKYSILQTRSTYGMPNFYQDDLSEFKKIINENHDKLPEKLKEKEESYKDYVYNMYLEVPKENEKVIKEFCEKYNLTKDTKDIEKRIAEIFYNDYEYNLAPGRTPSNEDFINYFLTKQKKGYCVYFASATTMILRYLGIPARYTTGYVLWQSDKLSGQSVSMDIFDEHDMIEDFSYKDKVLTFELTDAAAHAWVEEYVDGYGWVSVETTPPTDDEDRNIEDDGFLSDFINNNVFTAANYENIKKTMKNTAIGIIRFVIIFLFIYLVTGFIFRVKRKNEKDIDKKYEYLCKLSSFMGEKRKDEEAIRDFSDRMINIGLMDEKSSYDICRIVEKNRYSNNNISDEEKEYVLTEINNIRKNLYKNLNKRRRFIFKYFKWL